MKSIRLIQREISRLIRMAMVTYPIDLGKFTVRSLEKILKKVKRDLELDFDDIKVYPGAQPRESADIELYLRGKLIKKISVKTAVSGNLETTLRRLRTDKKIDEDGILVAFALAMKNETPVATKMIIFYIPATIIDGYPLPDILLALRSKIEEKAKKENYDSLDLIAINEAILFEQAYQSIIAKEIAEEARDEARKAKDEARRAREIAEEAKDEARKAREIAEEILKLLKSGKRTEI